MILIRERTVLNINIFFIIESKIFSREKISLPIFILYLFLYLFISGIIVANREALKKPFCKHRDVEQRSFTSRAEFFTRRKERRIVRYADECAIIS